MKRTTQRILLAGLVFGAPIATKSAMAQEQIDTGPVSVFYVNGVNTTPEAAQASLIELNNAWNDLAEPRGLRFSLAYNPTDGLVKDVIEAGNQSGIDTTRILQMVNGIVVWDQDLFDKYLDLVKFSMMRTTVTGKVIDDHVAAYVARLNQASQSYRGHKVILVSHSQGNLFANDALEKLSAEQKSCVWNVGVATPDNRLEPKGKYSTLERDRVIAAARFFRERQGITTLPQVSKHDPSNEPSLGNTGAHGFVEAYLLRGTQVRNEIMDNMRAARRAARPADAPCSPTQPGDPETPGPQWTFLLRESRSEAYARSACQAGIDDCDPYFTGAEEQRTSEQAGVSGLSASAGPNFSEVTYTVRSGSGVGATVKTRHVVISRGTPGPENELYYPYGTARSSILARWTLNATGRDRDNELIPSFSFDFSGTSTSKLTYSPDPFILPDESDDPPTGIWLCPFPRLFFVNDVTGASYITQVGDVGGNFSAGGLIAAGQYTVTLVAGGDQLTLSSGQMDDGQYPERSILCEQDATFRLDISHGP